MKQTLLILSLLVLGGCRSEIDRTQWVNPLVGSGGHGHVFVGASVPHGMVAVGPNNISQGWDWCSGYHDSDRTIAGFAQNHLSGTGIADLGEIVVMPFTGAARLERGPAPMTVMPSRSTNATRRSARAITPCGSVRASGPN